jgi:predicted Zn-dependent protease with MMP-like domain
MDPALRDKFDALLQAEIDRLPPALHEMLEEVPVVVDDEPSDEVLESLGMTRDEAHELCGLHTGIANTERSFADADLPAEIQLYRVGIVEEAGGWDVRAVPDADVGPGGEAAVAEQIRITLLHEIGHQFGLNEDDLDRLGYA